MKEETTINYAFVQKNYNQNGSGAEVNRPFLDGFLGFYTTDGYVVYKILDSKIASEVSEEPTKKGLPVSVPDACKMKLCGYYSRE